MGPTRAAGYPNYGSDGNTGYIPIIFSPKLNVKFYLSTVFAAISNTDYEGEIASKGDTVRIRVVPDVTISDYEIGGGLTYETLSADYIDLNIDKAKSFGFKVNDIDKMQSDLDQLDKWTDEVANKQKIAVDRDILGSVYTDVNAANAGNLAGLISQDIALGVAATPKDLTKDNIIDYIIDHGVVLDEANVPESGRWIVLPAWACGMIKSSDFKDASMTGDRVSIARNGRVGMIDRFEVYMSNNLTSAGGETNIIAGHPSGLTFASQMTNSETLRNQDDFGNLVRGLQVYGYEVVNDFALTHGVIAKG